MRIYIQKAPASWRLISGEGGSVSKTSFRDLLGSAAVVAGLVFVGVEIRQSTITAKATAYQELGLATAEVWAGMTDDPELLTTSTYMTRAGRVGPVPYPGLEATVKVMANWMTWFRIAETVHLQVEQGLLPPDAMNELGYETTFDNPGAACLWPFARDAMGQSFRTYLERTQDFAQYDCSVFLARFQADASTIPEGWIVP